MYRLIESHSTGETVTVEGHTLPVPSICEDADGIRLLLLAEGSSEVPVRLWQDAYDAGVAFIAHPLDRELPWTADTTEHFIENRQESAQSLYFGLPRFSSYDGQDPPNYRDLPVVTDSNRGGEDQPVSQDAVTPFVHLHTHFEWSTLDGYSRIEEGLVEIVNDHQPAAAMTDHGNCAGHPEWQKQCEAAGVKAVFGMEAYLQEDRFRRTRVWYEDDGLEVDPAGYKDKTKLTRKSDAEEARWGYNHITLWAGTDKGLRNIWAMSTEAYADGLFDGKPRLDWTTLERFSEGVLAGTGCLRGPVSVALRNGDVETARSNLARLMGIYGDRLYVEMHVNHLPEQMKVNEQLAVLAQEMSLPVIAVVDSHYARPDQAEDHRMWLAVQTNKDLTDDTELFAGGQPYHMMTATEVVRSLDYMAEQGWDVMDWVVRTTEVADRCNAKVYGEVKTPTYSKVSKTHPDPIVRDKERLIEIALANWDRKVKGKPHSEEVYAARFEKELGLLVRKGFCGYFLIVWDYVAWAKANGILVGPGRGSGGGSLIAYLMDIVELDPVKDDIIFERFLTEGRTSLPDFDIDFPASKRSLIEGYVEQRWGHDYVAKIGTVGRLRVRAALDAAARVMKSLDRYEVPFKTMADFKDTITEAEAALAGKAIGWDEWAVQFESQIQAFGSAYPGLLPLAQKIVGRVKSYGKHPAGIVISTGEPLTDLPMRLAVDEKTGESLMVTQFDMNALEEIGYVKFDILTLRNLDTIQRCIDLVEERFGRRINVYDWDEEYSDPQVWEEVAAGRTLGIFQIETKGGTRMTKRYAPDSIAGLAAVVTLVRPGPMNSGLTETYLRRRAGIEPVSLPDPRMEASLAESYGAMIYQEQVMQTCMTLANYNEDEADGVRKILGKKKVELVQAAGEEFVPRAIANGTDPQVAAFLWEQMAEFAKYGFGKAHAYGYAYLGFWTAWLKFHFPVQFITSALDTVDDDRLPEFVAEARRMAYTIEPPDVNISRATFTPEQTSMRYGISNVKGVGKGTADQIVTRQPYASMEDFIERVVDDKETSVDRGTLKALVSVGAFDALIGNRKAVELQMEREASGEAKRCVHVDLSVVNPVTGLKCDFDWTTEENPPMLARGRGKAKVMVPKDPPKACNIRCRQYLKPEVISIDEVTPYSPAEIRAKERELLGVWLSSSPFDRLSESDITKSMNQEQMEEMRIDTDCVTFAVIESVRERDDRRSGDKFAFLNLTLKQGSVDAVIFSRLYSTVRGQIPQDTLVGVQLWKAAKGFQVHNMMIVP